MDGEATYLAQVVEMEKTWLDLPGVVARGPTPFPFHFTKEEITEIESDVNGALRGMEAMREVSESLGELFPEQGIVRNDQYEEARAALRQIREQVIDAFAKDERDRELWR